MSQQWSDLKDAIITKLISIVNNPHTSISSVGFLALKIAAMMYPNKKDLINNIADLCISYGLVMAGDAKPRQAAPVQPTQQVPIIKG